LSILSKKSIKKPRKKVPKKRVHGYWVFSAVGGHEARYVKVYLRKRPKKRKKRLVIRVRPHRPEKTIPQAPKGYVLVRRYDYFAEHPDADEVPEEKERFTFKLCCLVELSYKYTVSFARHDEGAERHYRTIQYYHTQFMPSIQEATTDLHEKVVVMRALGDVHFISVDLYAVSGQGLLRERRWDLIASYVTPEEVPNAKL
jgi:hypothetical protein